MRCFRSLSGGTVTSGGLATAGRAQAARQAATGAPAAGLAAPKLGTIRWGLVGIGARGLSHVEQLLRLEGCQITALCDPHGPALARGLAAVEKAARPRPQAFGEGPDAWRRLVDRSDVDAVPISTPWELHVPMAVGAMRAGKHAFIEVPAAVTLDESWQLVETAESTRRHCMMLENVCYGREELMVLHMCRRQLFGDLTHAEAAYIHDLRAQEKEVRVGDRQLARAALRAAQRQRDEPTNHLDIVSIRWLTQFLRNWKNELIIITHDRNFLDSVTTHTMAIHRLKIKKIEGPTEKLYQQILQEEEIYEKTRINDAKKRKEVEEFINRFRVQANKAKAVQSRIKALAKKEKLDKLSEIKSLDFEFNPRPFTGRRLLEAQEVTFAFAPESAPLIKDFSISIEKNDRIAIIGKNGKGKSTLLNLLSRELQPMSGTVRHHPDLHLAYFGQTNINRLNLSKTVEQEIMDAHPDHSRGAARKICGAMMFGGDHALKKISVLSGGEKSRVLLGKLLVKPSNMLMLDEPTNHLDMESIDSLIEALEVFKGAVMIVTHSEMVLHAVARKLIVFDDNEVKVFEGTYQDFLDRVGWKSEGDVIPSSAPQVSAAASASSINKKNLRKLKAEIMTERTKTIGPLPTGGKRNRRRNHEAGKADR